MSYKTVKATKLGTVGLSIGIVHFDPERGGGRPSRGDKRYRTRVLPTADAQKAERKGVAKITGDATKEDFDKQLVEDRQRSTGDAAAARIEDSIAAEEDEKTAGRGKAAVGNTKAVNFPESSPARTAASAPSAGDLDPDAAPLTDDDDDDGTTETASEPEVLKQTIPKLEKALETGEHDGSLDTLLTAEEAHQKRDGAIKAIKDRKEKQAAAGS